MNLESKIRVGRRQYRFFMLESMIGNFQRFSWVIQKLNWVHLLLLSPLIIQVSCNDLRIAIVMCELGINIVVWFGIIYCGLKEGLIRPCIL